MLSVEIARFTPEQCEEEEAEEEEEVQLLPGQQDKLQGELLVSP